MKQEFFGSCNKSNAISFYSFVDLYQYFESKILSIKNLAFLQSIVLLRLNQMLYVLCLFYHSNTEAVLFACLSSGWATTTGRLLVLKIGNSIKCLS